MSSPRVGVLYSRVRVEEKLLFEAFERRGVTLELLDDSTLVFDITDVRQHPYQHYDVIVERCINHSRALYSLKILNDQGVKTVNTALVADICGNKLMTTSALAAAGVPQPKALVAYTPESALAAIESLGYPVVLKPTVGSWGRLLSKVNDRAAAESILEHKETLGSYHHSIFYIQEYVKKPGRDIRAFVVGRSLLAAMERKGAEGDFRSNLHRGGSASMIELTPLEKSTALKAARSMGLNVAGVDMLRSAHGPVVMEVNSSPGLEGIEKATGVDVALAIIRFIERHARPGHTRTRGKG